MRSVELYHRALPWAVDGLRLSKSPLVARCTLLQSHGIVCSKGLSFMELHSTFRTAVLADELAYNSRIPISSNVHSASISGVLPGMTCNKGKLTRHVLLVSFGPQILSSPRTITSAGSHSS